MDSIQRGALVKLKGGDRIMKCTDSPDKSGGVECLWHSGNRPAHGYFKVENLILSDGSEENEIAFKSIFT